MSSTARSENGRGYRLDETLKVVQTVFQGSGTPRSELGLEETRLNRADN